ncbi:hypothetical protein TNCV_1408391 [Trichonephila clavipes]|uniref:Uncharacterized protein n=1 Tax=Trichonephila clavipes TaxID=2585209 RepID=A0A8X6RA62_TRICX|nr:hypothetical protein TNCV_1408391 [Trichonephila clavipes]
MNFVKDRVFDRLISLEKGKVSSKISQLRKRHKVGQSLTSIQNNEDEWSISSTREVLEVIQRYFLLYQWSSNCVPQNPEVPKVNVAAVAEWYRYRTGACFVTGSSPVPLKTRRIVRVLYFVRGGFVGHRSRAVQSISPLIFRSTGLDSSGVKKGLRCSCKMHVWVSGPTKMPTALDVRRSDVTALALSYRTFLLRKV